MPKPDTSSDTAAVTLAAQPGTDEANHDTTRFPVSDAGTVEVPPEAVDPLTQVGGFTVVTDPAINPDVVKLVHADKIGCSFRGTTYEPDEDGAIEVPAHAVGELASHGFTKA